MCQSLCMKINKIKDKNWFWTFFKNIFRNKNSAFYLTENTMLLKRTFIHKRRSGSNQIGMRMRKRQRFEAKGKS